MAVITAFFAWGAKDVKIATVFTELLPSNHPFVKTFLDHPNFGNPLTIQIMVRRTDGTIYNPETLGKVWDLTRDIDLAPAVDHRSEERRVGKECVSTCRSRWSRYH